MIYFLFCIKKNKFMLWSPWHPRRGVRKELGVGESGLTLIVSAEVGKGVALAPAGHRAGEPLMGQG